MNPCGITQVDVPGILSVYDGARQRRTEQMLMERKIAAEDKAIARQDKLLGIYSRIQRPAKGGDPVSSQGVAGAYAQPPAAAPAPDASVPMGSPLVPSPAPTAASTTPSAPAAAPVAAAPPQSWMDANADIVSELLAVDPAEAFKLSDHLSKMDEVAVKAAKENNKTIGSVAMHLMSLPPEARPAELQRMAPQLAQIGVDAGMLSRADLSDQGLQGYIAQALDVEKIIEQQNKDRSHALEQERFGETRRHNRVSEGQGAARLGVAQGNLSLSRERLKRGLSRGPRSSDIDDLDY
jgi:hypothetical protein